ncbi:hypothetical protein HHX47_DHR7000300 [Lentinula edodes]|nr:hypothetical protein HHX47_DHR7000300 [Lentinula edodes]
MSRHISALNCDFTTVDPGSLTRHRKRIHGYIPKSRRSRHPKPTTTISSDDGSSRISSNQNDGGEGSSSMQTTVHEGQDSESYSGPYDTGHVQSSHQSQSLLLDESISRPNFNQAPISRFITTLSSSTSTSAPIPMTTKRISRARMEEVEAAEAAEKARAIEILSGLRHSIEEGNFDTGDADAVSTASVRKVREGALSTNEAMCQPAGWDGIKGENGNPGAISAPGSGS